MELEELAEPGWPVEDSSDRMAAATEVISGWLEYDFPGMDEGPVWVDAYEL